MTNDTEIDIACVPGAIPVTKRVGHFMLARRLFMHDACERSALPDGYAFRFEPAALADVARFIDNERKCCPFLTFQLEIGPGEAPLWLRMTGPEGTRPVLDAELSPSGAC